MLFWLVLLVFIVSFVVVVFYKRRTAVSLCVCFASAALLVVHIGSAVLFHLNQEEIAAEALEKVTRIAWDDEAQLHTLGFEKREGMMIYDSPPSWSGPGNVTFFQICVEEADDEEIGQTQGLKSHKDILYTENTSYGYANALLEFLHYPETASRSYLFCVDDRLVSVREHNNHDTNRLFENHLIDLEIEN